jgi:hypothetical protein
VAPTIGAVIPWTIAGLPALLILIFRARSVTRTVVRPHQN